ncbi:MAG: tetratricopeptide repeat protein [Planctomycetaceae bacterium]
MKNSNAERLTRLTCTSRHNEHRAVLRQTDKTGQLQYRRVGFVLAVMIGGLGITPPEVSQFLGPQAAHADQAADDYAAAVGFYKQSRWGLAEETFQKFLKDHPKHERVPFARLYLGLALTNLEKYDEARTVLRAFVKDYPNNQQVPQAMYRVAESSYFLDDLKSAEPEFQAFIAKSPEDSLREYALPYFGDTLLRLGKAEEAAANFQQAIKLFPQSKMLEDSRWGLAKSLDAQQKIPEAMVLYREIAANKAGARAAQAQLQIANRLFEQKDFANAAKSYTDLEKNFPESKHVPTARLNAGNSYYELKDYKSAATQFELAAKEPAQAATASYWRGMSQKQLGDMAGAATTLKATFEAHAQSPIAEQVLFQWADCELRLSQFDSAELHFADVVKRWPQSPWADDSLYFAGEAALQRANRAATPEIRTAAIQAAESYTKQFTATQPNSGLKLYNDLLRGRVLLSRGSDADATAAVELIKAVLAAAQRPQTQGQARYHLARAQQRLKQHAAVIETLTPVVEQVRKEGAASEFIDGLVLFASSALAEKKDTEAIAAAADYVRLAPKGEQLDQALVTKAVAEANLKQLDAAKQSIGQLRTALPNSPLLVRTTLQLAEIAYAQKEFNASLDWYTAAVAAGPQSPHFVPALSGLAWSQFEKKQYKPAATAFAQLLKDFPQHALAPEAAFKLGESLQLDNQLEPAAKAFAEAFESYSPGRYGFLAGLEAARTLRRLDKVEDADAAYSKLFVKFPKPENLDKLLEEWALLNYESERFTRADEIFKRLLAEAPNSDVADNARFNLAESELLSGKIDDAKAAFRQLEQSPKSDADVQQDSLFRLMAIADEQQQWEELAKVATAIRTRFAEGRYKTDAAFFLALSHLQRQQAEPALEQLKPLVAAKTDPEMKTKDWFPRVFVLLAEIQWQQKNYAESIATVADFRAWDAKSKLLYQADEVLGRAYKSQGKFDEARAAFKQVIDDPNGTRTETAAKAQLMLAETYYFQKDYKTALEQYLRVYLLYKFPEWQAPALFQAGACDEQLGEWAKAVADYESLLKEFPQTQWATDAKPRLEAAKQKAKK